MMSEATHLWSIRWRPLAQSYPRFRFAQNDSVINHLSQSARCLVLRSAIQIALQNHLRRDLVNVAAGVPSFLAGITQCTVGCDCRESLVPCDDGAGENRP